MSWSAAWIGSELFPEPMGEQPLLCSCGKLAAVVADLSGHGLYIRTPICGRDCPHVRSSVLTCDVVLDSLLPAIVTRTCWCHMMRRGRHVTWCPRHGQIDAVAGVCS